MIDGVIVGLWPHEPIAQTGLAHAQLTLLLLDTGNTDHGDIDLFHYPAAEAEAAAGGMAAARSLLNLCKC